MKPERSSQRLLAVTRSKAKMYEYSIEEAYHIDIQQDPAKLFTITIGMIGDFAAKINREGIDQEANQELRNNLRFSAYFFDAYLKSRLNTELDPYLILLGAASYYLCDLPGSAAVLASQITDIEEELDGGGVGNLLLHAIRSNLSDELSFDQTQFVEICTAIKSELPEYFDNGENEDVVISLADNLKSRIYEVGTPRQLLLGDITAAILRKKIKNSTWKSIPIYSDLPTDRWAEIFSKPDFIKELWPAQHLLGEAGVFRGRSAVVQMPTSAGKTKATELILRSAFLADRVTLAAIVAPFKALCHEIRNSLSKAFDGEDVMVDELTDTLQKDFDIEELLQSRQIIIVTPEKFLYALRHNSELATSIGLIVFDEGHQFDSGIRGVTYELLLTSLRDLLPEGAQKVLISAVIKNSTEIGEWLNKDEANVVKGTNLNPTIRSVGFASWLDQLGRIEYITESNPDQGAFFVPRVIERFNLGTRGRESKDRIFPEGKDGKQIALYLGLKVVISGSVAIFCGRKDTAVNIAEFAVDYIERGLPLELPLASSDQTEVEKLHFLHSQNLGELSAASKSASYGIFCHHGSTPHGVRLAVEHAMREKLIKFVVCTSTLAQGVNLPIRYLIITSVYQGKEKIKVRDFHNLIGRAGRAGMHTEGSILFADPEVYDERKSDKNWRWNQVKELLEPSNSEPCISNLLSIFDPLSSDDKNVYIDIDPLEVVKSYLTDREGLYELARNVATQHSDKNFTVGGVERQLNWKRSIISAIESFLLSHWEEHEGQLRNEDIENLAQGTLAFHLASEKEKEQIIQLFLVLGENVKDTIPEPSRRAVFGRTLFGLQDAVEIRKWVIENLDAIRQTNSPDELLEQIWALFPVHIHSKVFKKFDKPDLLLPLARLWIAGESFSRIFEFVNDNGAKMFWGEKRRRAFKVHHMVELSEGALAYDGALIIGAVYEILNDHDDSLEDVLGYLLFLQKALSYGLPNESSIGVYELGFNDRVVSQDIVTSLGIASIRGREIVAEINQDHDAAMGILEKYPKYYQDRLSRYLR